MLKFAFIINVPGADPETYSAVYENPESCSIIAGVDGMEAGKEYVKKLTAEGYTLFNLCGDFDDDITEQMREEAGDGVDIDHAAYSIDELVKLNRLQSFKYYGIIIAMDGVEEPYETVIRNDECVTTAIFIKDMKQAKKAAKTLVDRKVDFIELCSWFDRLMMEEIVDYIDGAVPVGTCGDLDMKSM